MSIKPELRPDREKSRKVYVDHMDFEASLYQVASEAAIEAAFTPLAVGSRTIEWFAAAAPCSSSNRSGESPASSPTSKGSSPRS